MTRIVETKTYICEICEKEFKNPEDARKCNFSHDIVYLPIERADLKGLVQFIYTGEQRLLSNSLIKLLIKYGNIKAE
jgi:hypothetical protein